MSKEAMKLALSTLLSTYPTCEDQYVRERAAIAALRSALAEQPAQQQEPVPDWDAWNACSRLNSALEAIGDFAHDKLTGPAEPDALWEIRTMAYDAIEHGALADLVDVDPQPAQRKPLTNLEGLKLACKHHWLNNLSLRDAYILGIRDAEAAHGIKEENT